MKQKLNNKGFTFVELVVAVAILSIVMVSVVSFMGTVTSVYSRTHHGNEVQDQSQEVYDQISSCIMQANKVILYGAPENSSGSFDSTNSYYVTNDQKNVIGVDASGNLVNSNKKTMGLVIPRVDTSGSAAGTTGVQVRAFQSLERYDDATSSYVYKRVKVKALYFEYQSKIGADYVTCAATFVIGDDGNLYLNRHYSTDTNYATYSAGSGEYARLDLGQSDDSILCKTVKEDGFQIVIDANGNSIGLAMDFDNKSMIYDTLGMVKIRNNAVLMK